jgi:hypothetical protein
MKRDMLPKSGDGTVDVEGMKAQFMASKHLNWTQFAWEMGLDPQSSRVRLPVRDWIREKRDKLTAEQVDILSGLIHERKFKWTNEIIKTLDTYPEAIDAAMNVAKMKIQQINDLYKDYVENFRGQPDKMFYKGKRRYHAFEKMSALEVSLILRGMKDITEAKLKALMLDKWAVAKLDMPLDEPVGEDGETSVGPVFTIEGRENVSASDLQTWFERYHDKPVGKPDEADGGS